MTGARSAFHPDDVDQLIGPAAAFALGSDSTPGIYALQNHLALEVVAQLQRDGAPIVFRGGTALYTKLPQRQRFSIDVDLSTTSPEAVHVGLIALARRWQKSEVRLLEPPGDLRVEGVRHTLAFRGLTPAMRVLVEVVELPELLADIEPTRLRVAELDWGVEARTPTLAAFVGQKLAVLGPTTIGKAVGRNQAHARGNQGVCKQIFDLRELLRHGDLDAGAIDRAYDRAILDGNRLRTTSHERSACLEDARRLLSHLVRPRSSDKNEELRYGLWSGFDDSKRWIVERSDWREQDYRIAAGVITRLATGLQLGALDMQAIRAPLVAAAVPAEIIQQLATAEREEAVWFISGAFGGNARIAWAWAPPEVRGDDHR